jgi:hypothetical protein
VLPEIRAGWLRAYREACDRYAPKRTGAGKRTAAAIKAEVDRLRSARGNKRRRTE